MPTVCRISGADPFAFLDRLHTKESAMACKVRVVLADSEDRQVEVVARYSAATDNYFDRAWGNWHPGDPEDVEVLSVTAIDEGANVAEVEADDAAIEEAVREAADDAARDAEEMRAEAAEERRRERAQDYGSEG